MSARAACAIPAKAGSCATVMLVGSSSLSMSGGPGRRPWCWQRPARAACGPARRPGRAEQIEPGANGCL